MTWLNDGVLHPFPISLISTFFSVIKPLAFIYKYGSWTIVVLSVRLIRPLLIAGFSACICCHDLYLKCCVLVWYSCLVFLCWVWFPFLNVKMPPCFCYHVILVLSSFDSVWSHTVPKYVQLKKKEIFVIIVFFFVITEMLLKPEFNLQQILLRIELLHGKILSLEWH